MSFSPETEKLVQDLIQAEYKNACSQFGEKYHSLHEGYAVLLEEVEEVEENIKLIKNGLASYWFYVKNEMMSDIETSLAIMQGYSENAMKELAQVGAVLMKKKNTISEVEE